MSSSPKYTPQYTYDDYLLWEGKWELIDGVPYAMSPSPNFRHQRIAAELSYLFTGALKKCRHCKVSQPFDWKVAENTVLQPDMLVICKPVTNNNFLDFPPTLVAEVVSPSSSKTDRREKFEIYEAQGVKYYLILDPGFNKLEVFQIIEGSYQTVALNPSDFVFIFDDGCEASVDFSELFAD
jgi:Uma2 family endonuclease